VDNVGVTDHAPGPPAVAKGIVATPSIRRAEGQPPLSMRDLPRLLGSDESLRPAGEVAVQWQSQFTQAAMRLQLHEGALVVHGLQPAHREEGLAKLRHVAGRLGARVHGEQGQDLTEPPAPPARTGGAWARVGQAALFVLVLPASIAVMVLRIPVLLWKLWRVK
jgi:hypothetical protein